MEKKSDCDILASFYQRKIMVSNNSRILIVIGMIFLHTEGSLVASEITKRQCNKAYEKPSLKRVIDTITRQRQKMDAETFTSSNDCRNYITESYSATYCPKCNKKLLYCTCDSK